MGGQAWKAPRQTHGKELSQNVVYNQGDVHFIFPSRIHAGVGVEGGRSWCQGFLGIPLSKWLNALMLL